MPKRMKTRLELTFTYFRGANREITVPIATSIAINSVRTSMKAHVLRNLRAR